MLLVWRPAWQGLGLILAWRGGDDAPRRGKGPGPKCLRSQTLSWSGRRSADRAARGSDMSSAGRHGVERDREPGQWRAVHVVIAHTHPLFSSLSAAAALSRRSQLSQRPGPVSLGTKCPRLLQRGVCAPQSVLAVWEDSPCYAAIGLPHYLPSVEGTLGTFLGAHAEGRSEPLLHSAAAPVTAAAAAIRLAVGVSVRDPM